MKSSICLSEEPDGLSLRFMSSPALIHYASKIPGLAYDERTGAWRTDRRHSLFVKEFCEFAVSRGLATDIVRTEADSQTESFADRMPDLEDTPGLLIQPYAYQRRGIRYMMEHKRTFNCDDMGLGKTFQTIAAIHLSDAYPALVVCPAAMKVTWQREFRRFAGVSAVILSDENRDRWRRFAEFGTAKVFVVNYESLKKYFVRGNRGSRVTAGSILLKEGTDIFRSVTIDECHRCKEKQTLWSRYLERICAGKEYVFMLTGTPVVTGNRDLMQQLRIMGRLEDFGGQQSFLSRYCGKDVSPAVLSELNCRLWQTCYFRRDKSLVLKELPGKIRQYNVVELTNRKDYDAAEADLFGYLRRMEDCDDARMEKVLRGEAIVRIGILRRLSAEGKLAEAVAHIEDVLAAGDKIIVFAVHKEVVRKLRKHFPSALTVTGSQTAEEKQKAVDLFQHDAARRVIIVNVKSGGVGLTLTAASSVLFVEFPWTAADCDQCECRAHRNGQQFPVSCTYLLGKDTFDETICGIIQKERSEAGTVTGAVNDVEERMITTAKKYYQTQETKMITIREKIYLRMKALGVKQTAMSEDLGIGSSNLSSYLNGRRQIAYESLERICQYLGLTVVAKDSDDRTKNR